MHKTDKSWMHNAWLASWLQDRRRRRQAGTPAAPVAPASPVITAIAYDQGSIWLDFTCATPGLVSNYQIFRSVDEEVHDFYDNAGLANMYVDYSPSGGNGYTHYYWVVAEGPGGFSDFSNLMTVVYP